MQSSSQIITTNKPTSSFLQADALPLVQPTVSKHDLLKGVILSLNQWLYCYVSVATKTVGILAQ